MLFLRRFFVGDIFGFVSQELYVQVEVILFCLKQYIENSFGRRERQRVEFSSGSFYQRLIWLHHPSEGFVEIYQRGGKC